jgi:hypothetical protein
MRAAAFFALIFAMSPALVRWSACSSSSSSGATSTIEAGTGTPPTVCNGHAELCSRAYNAVAFPGDHDSDANVADQFVAADQPGNVTAQLEGGIRVLHFEMQQYQGDTYLCHAVCGIGHMLLLDDLKMVDAFVTAHPTEVVTLLMESQNTTSDQIATAVNSAGLMPFVHTQAAGAPWPTLSQMIQHGDHVVIFNADLTMTGGTSFPWLFDRFAKTWETPWDNTTPADFAKCDADRGTKGNDIYVVDTYREDTPIATTSAAASVNTNPFLIDRLLTCKKNESTLPNFVMVNFFEIGDALKDVDILNGLSPTPTDDLSQFPPAEFPGSDDGGISDASADSAIDSGDQ